jgi:hypothetical protein
MPAPAFPVHLNLQTRREFGEHVHVCLLHHHCHLFVTQNVRSGVGRCACVPWQVIQVRSCLTRVWPGLWMGVASNGHLTSAPSATHGPALKKGNLCDGTTVFHIARQSGLCEHATSFLFRVCRISTSVLWHYSAIRRNGRFRLIRKEKKRPRTCGTISPLP